MTCDCSRCGSSGVAATLAPSAIAEKPHQTSKDNIEDFEQVKRFIDLRRINSTQTN